MELIDLEKLIGLSPRFLEQLDKNKDLFMRFDSFERIEQDDDIHFLIEQINDYCNNNLILGYHYTRALENDILKNGLLIRTGSEIRNEFIKNHHSIFSKSEIDEILNAWECSFDKQDEEVRDNRIWFNFTKDALKNGGAELLLKYYGGEQVYAPIYQINGIGSKLSKIGVPLIVKCRLKPQEITTFSEYSWGKIAVSSYHRLQNLEALVFDQDGYQTCSVSSTDIKLIKI
jgi:hypothetical protein